MKEKLGNKLKTFIMGTSTTRAKPGRAASISIIIVNHLKSRT